jgi:signal transduction histidine kinase
MVMLTLSSATTETGSAAVTQLTEIHRKIANLLHSMPAAVVPEVARLGLIGALRETVAHELGRAFDGVTWQIEPEAEQATRRVPTLTAEVIFFAAREAIRNAARYGRDSDAGRSLHLTIAARWRDGLELIVEDDGVGMGIAGPAAGSSGQGLALHSTMMAVIGGTLTTDSVPGEYTRIALTLPQGAWDVLAG